MEEENIEVPKLENLGNIISLDPEFEEEVIQLIDSSEAFAKWLYWIESEIEFFKKGYYKCSVKAYSQYMLEMIKGLVCIQTHNMDGWESRNFKGLKEAFQDIDKLEFVQKIWILGFAQESYIRNQKGQE